ncbi:MAG: hypothetical protein ACKV2T_34780 [Kofleriaceae bacterium]
MRSIRRVFALFALLAACHVTRRSEIVEPIATERVVHHQGAQPRKPALVLTDVGTLRFIEPLECPTEDKITVSTIDETEIQPNLATFVVGVIATSIGGILLVRGVTGDDVNSPFTYGGALGLVAGLPFAIGPWIGNRTERIPRGDKTQQRRPGPSEACGERGLPASVATLSFGGIEVFGKVDKDGTFSISPYQLVDALDTTRIPTWDITATIETPAGQRTIQALVEGGALATRAPAYLVRLETNMKVEPIRLVPGIVPGTLRASLTQTIDGPAMRIVIPLKNDGPGEAWAIRGLVASTTTKAIDGRVLYIGHLAKGSSATPELLIPLTQAAAESIRNATIELTVELRDAHGTAPTTPIRFRGVVLVDLPR